MTIFLIVIGIAIFVFYLFNNDRKDQKAKVLKIGGMKSIFPNFLQYINMTTDSDFSLFDFNISSFELVKDNGEYLEYKFPNKNDQTLFGYYYIGIQHSFVTFAYCYCININGNKIEVT
jgi:hypothetical protein